MLKVLLSYFPLLIPCILLAQEDVRTVGELPGLVSETSGLIFYNGRLITHNDSGNEAKLFEIDTTSLQVVREVVVSNAQNVDWEDMAQDEIYIYVGDFGNSLGTRTDLTVYRISKEEYAISDRVDAEAISFEYEDQDDFSNNGESDWDAEALFVLDDELVVLTKQWLSYGTVAYGIPNSPGTHVARVLDRFSINGLVTGAALNPNTEELLVTGYSIALNPFLVRIQGVTRTTIFTTNVERLNLDIGPAQVEGIAYANHDLYFFASEIFSGTNPNMNLEPLLFSFHTGSMEAGEEIPLEDPIDSEDNQEEVNEETNDEINDETSKEINEELILFKSFGSDILEYRLVTSESVYGYTIFDTSGRRVLHKTLPVMPESTIDVSALESFVYYLTFYFGNKSLTKPFIGN